MYQKRKLYKPPFLFGVGDTVRLMVLGENPCMKKFEYEVILRIDRIQEQFSTDENGVQIAPLLHGKILNYKDLCRAGILWDGEDSEDKLVSACFLKELVARAKVRPRPTNIYDTLYDPAFKIIGGKYHGDLWYMVAYELGQLPHHIDRPIKENLYFLFWKNNPGRKQSDVLGRMTVNRRALRRWVQQNWTRLLATKDELWEIAAQDRARQLEAHHEDLEHAFADQQNPRIKIPALPR